MTFSAISATSPVARQSTVSYPAREAALEKEIASKVSEAECTDCKDTAAKAAKDADNLRAELAALKAQETQGASGSLPAAGRVSDAQPAENRLETPQSSGETRDAASRGGLDTRADPRAVRISPSVQAALTDLQARGNEVSVQNWADRYEPAE